MKKLLLICIILTAVVFLYKKYSDMRAIYAPDSISGKITLYNVETFPYTVFGKDFLFGISTAAPQIEEISCDKCPHIPHAPNTLNKSYIDRFRTDAASIEKFKNWQEPEHSAYGYSKAQELVDLAADLGCNAYRFTIEWSRVNPAENVFASEVIDHYADLAKYVRSKNMEPIVFLNHYVDPIWFIDLGGFENRDNLEYFVTYSKKMIDALSPYVDKFVSLNQPAAYVRKGYVIASQMPFEKTEATIDGTFPRAEKVLYNVYDAIHEIAKYIKQQGKQSGICHQYAQTEIASEKTDKAVWYAHNFDRFYNQRFFNYFKDKLDIVDFVAWQYYSRLRFGVNPDGSENPAMLLPEEFATHTDDYFRFVDEEGFYNSLEVCAKHFPNKPIYVTENGCNTSDELYAINYLNHYLSALILAKQHGINIKGYFYWTLIDNYEWGKNFDANYGMFTRIDHAIKERGKYYRQFILKAQGRDNL